MSMPTVLIVFSLVGAVMCARARAAGPALIFGVFAVLVLFTASPAGEQVTEFVGSVSDAVRQSNSGGAR